MKRDEEAIEHGNSITGGIGMKNQYSKMSRLLLCIYLTKVIYSDSYSNAIPYVSFSNNVWWRRKGFKGLKNLTVE